jgi:hypothetical protein
MPIKRLAFSFLLALISIMLGLSPDSIQNTLCAWSVEFIGFCPEFLNTIVIVRIFIGMIFVSLISILIGYFFERLSKKNKAEESLDTIPGYEALRLVNEAQPNSYQTSSINLADAARLGLVRAWGRPKPKMAIPDYIAAVEPIPPDIWAYALLNASLVHGPLASSDMMYRQPFVKPHVKDDRLLYDAVRFNRRDIVELCKSEKIKGNMRIKR